MIISCLNSSEKCEIIKQGGLNKVGQGGGLRKFPPKNKYIKK